MFSNSHPSFECPLQFGAKKWPDDPIFFTQDNQWTYSQWNDTVNRISHWLCRRNFSHGSRIALRASASFYSLSVIVALWRLKVVICPLSLNLTDKQMQKIKKTLRWEECWDEGDLKDIYDSSLQEKDCFESERWNFSDWATIMSSSGTLGQPKHVVCNHSCHYYSAKGVEKLLNIQGTAVWSFSLSLHHIGGFSILCRALYIRSLAVRVVENTKNWKSLFAKEVTHLSFVPTQLKRMIQDKKILPLAKRLSAIVVGGAPICSSLLKEAWKEHLPVFISYGATEMSSQVLTVCRSEAIFSLEKNQNPFFEVRLKEDGEIMLRGKPLFCGYWTHKGLQRPFDSKGWYASGDIAGWVNSEKKDIVIKGRKDRMIISGGENIYPEEIESALLNIDFITQAHIVPYEHSEFGCRFVAFIEATQSWTPDLLKTYLRSRLEKFKLPDAFYPLSNKK